MSTVSTLKARIQRVLLETDSTGAIVQTNYFDNELWDYFNKAIEILSIELAKLHSRLDIQNTTITFAAAAYSDTTSISALSPAFLSLARNEKGQDRIFNITASGKPLMVQADESSVDDWEDETASDDGTPTKYYMRGNSLYIHPRPNVETQIKLYYNPLRTITNDSSTVPWNGLFDSAIEFYVITRCRMRSELMNYNPALDMSMTEQMRKMTWDIIFQREGFKMRWGSGFGWDG